MHLFSCFLGHKLVLLEVDNDACYLADGNSVDFLHQVGHTKLSVIPLLFHLRFADSCWQRRCWWQVKEQALHAFVFHWKRGRRFYCLILNKCHTVVLPFILIFFSDSSKWSLLCINCTVSGMKVHYSCHLSVILGNFVGEEK